MAIPSALPSSPSSLVGGGTLLGDAKPNDGVLHIDGIEPTTDIDDTSNRRSPGHSGRAEPDRLHQQVDIDKAGMGGLSRRHLSGQHSRGAPSHRPAEDCGTMVS